jgi:hypothetical protein
VESQSFVLKKILFLSFSCLLFLYKVPIVCELISNVKGIFLSQSYGLLVTIFIYPVFY